MRNTELSKRVEAETEYLKYWNQTKMDIKLKGIKSSIIHKLQY
jgi:hypothetical protein